jgi:hypothetical protein
MKRTNRKVAQALCGAFILIGFLAAGLYYLERPVEPAGGHLPVAWY